MNILDSHNLTTFQGERAVFHQILHLALWNLELGQLLLRDAARDLFRMNDVLQVILSVDGLDFEVLIFEGQGILQQQPGVVGIFGIKLQFLQLL